MAIPGRRDLQMYRGGTFDHLIEFFQDPGVDEQGDPLEPTEPLDVSGGSWMAMIRTATNGVLVATFAVDATEAAQGRIWLRLEAQLTRLPAKSYVWDIKHTVGSRVDPLLAGSVQMSGDVSRDD